MSATTTRYGTYYRPDPAVVNGEYGFTDKDGTFLSNHELRFRARAALLARVDHRSARDVLREALDDEQAADLLVDDIFQPEDCAEWAFDSETGLWEATS